MKILVLCEQGNNRSVTIAHHLKYWGHDVLAAGVATNSRETLELLGGWADRIIAVDTRTAEAVSGVHARKVQLWNVGPDTYPRPFHPGLRAKVQRLMEKNRGEYAPT